MIDPHDAWEPWPVNTELTSGPAQIYDNDADNETPPPPLIGFTTQPASLDDLVRHGANVYDPDGNLIGRAGPATPNPDGSYTATYEAIPLLWNGDQA